MQELRNVSSVFFVPTLNIGREKLRDNQFINAFVKDIQKEHYEDCVFLLFKPKNLTKFKYFLDEEYERTTSIIDEYDYEGGYVVIVYKLEERFKKDFELVKVGKYSQTSLTFQELFPKLLKRLDKQGTGKEDLSIQWRIFNKTPDMVELWENELGVDFNDKMEVWPTFNIEKETLDITKIKEDGNK